MWCENTSFVVSIILLVKLSKNLKCCTTIAYNCIVKQFKGYIDG